MEQITAQNMPQDLLTILSATGAAPGRRSAATQGGGDPFLQIIQNMVAQMGTGEDEGQDGEKNALTDQTLLAGYAGMLFGMPQTGIADVSGNGTAQEALLQLMGQAQGDRVQTVPDAVRQLLLQAVTPQSAAAVTQILGDESSESSQSDLLNQAFLQAMGQEETQQSTQGVAQTSAEAQAAAAQMQLPMTQSAASETTRQATSSSRTEGKSAVRTFLGQDSRRTAEENWNLQTQVQAVSGRDQSAGEQQSLLDGQQRFRNAVAQAKQALEGQSRKGAQKVEDILPTQLPPEIQTLQLQSAAAKLAEPKDVQAPPLLDQLTQGLNQELAQGKSEFTMTLKPEALGEITVKLTEKAGKMVVQITTASAQTAKLLNAELPALRETMRPMQVEVREAVSQSAQSNQTQMQFQMSSQQFANQQRAFAWQQETPYYAAAADGGDTLEEATQIAPETVHSNLNLYV